jgi:hypothetical protein
VISSPVELSLIPRLLSIQIAPAHCRPRRLRRVVAVLLSLLAAGLGHAFLGNVRAGLGWFAALTLSISVAVAGVVTGARPLVWISILLVGVIRIGALLDSMRTPSPPRTRGVLRTALILAAIIAVHSLQDVVTRQLTNASRQPTPAMFPTLIVGDHFVTSGWWRSLERGDIIVFDYPKDPTKLLRQPCCRTARRHGGFPEGESSPERESGQRPNH